MVLKTNKNIKTNKNYVFLKTTHNDWFYYGIHMVFENQQKYKEKKNILFAARLSNIIAFLLRNPYVFEEPQKNKHKLKKNQETHSYVQHFRK